ncbi:U32 family peptidase [Ancylomarina euxinus]|uniref:U32 family peptidase n=1 Tax=Ancylomarina euxinus TaxID=2283627 RepID=A0A425Y7Q3_9BACT|nr:peptidase U32 family protein [Ancylomarina euxinus]MCZ4693569.1 U32 family peptidase [Ancylomarina euxinus]MUP13797.1 U32 family peptidase [Ancylomarina euxinus]RRG24569.1 U32 family peptidase [Ancylomarina euxinus]
MKRTDIELMAPVGSYESLMAAIQGGANSIYFGIEQLNMRARSSNNFTKDDLREIVKICKENQVKTYLTVNTVLYDNEMNLMHEVIDSAKENGVTAVIAADVAAILYARSIGVEVHISTQCNITNIESVKFYSQFADVVVLARELNLDQVANIYHQIVQQDIRGPKGELVQIEMFAHGALCMAVSGKCYLSLHEKSSSANRGACMQTCRKAYTVTEKESGNELEIDNQYIMSPKDLCTIGFVNKLIDAGVRVLKFEGRARSPEYVKTVLSCYNEAVDAYLDGSYGEEKIAVWKEELSTVFNRGFWDGYYMGQKIGEWSSEYGNRATKRKMLIGKGTNYFNKIKVAEFLLESQELCVGDKILITGPTTGVVETTIEEIRVDLKPVEKAVKGDSFSIVLDTVIRRSDKLYKIVDVHDDLRQ